MKKRILFLALTFILAFSLVACGNDSGTSNTPTTETPAVQPTPTPTPSPTPTPEPTPTPHVHNWSEATYQAPKTCSECGETEGEALTPAFVENGNIINMVIGTTYDYNTICYEDVSKNTVGRLTITDYKVIESDEKHPPMEGYEWRIIQAKFEFDDNNAQKYGETRRIIGLDYYSSEKLEYYTNKDFYPDSGEDEIFTVNYDGNIFECFTTYNIFESGWSNHVSRTVFEAPYLLPVGYDGLVMAFYSGNHESDHDDFLKAVDFPAVLNDSNTLYFRLN